MVIPKVSEMLLLYQLIDEGLNTPYHTHSTVTDFAKFLGWSTLHPFLFAMWYDSS